MADLLTLVRDAQLNFLAQILDVVHLSIDRQLGAFPYIETYSESLAAGASSTSEGTTVVTAGQVWALTRLEHRDIEPSIFDMQVSMDGQEIFPTTRVETPHFLIALPKAYFVSKQIVTKVTNQDTVTKTFRQVRYWMKYDRIALNKFLSGLNLPEIK